MPDYAISFFSLFNEGREALCSTTREPNQSLYTGLFIGVQSM